MARKLASTSQRSAANKQTISLEELPLAASQAREAAAAQQRLAAEQAEQEAARYLDCLRRCLPRLPLTERAFMKEYYDDDEKAQIENHKRLAARLKLSMTGLRTRAHRLRNKLEQCVKGCVARG